MSLWICPICGKQCSINLYDPTDFEDDILIILLRGLGKGKGFEIVEKYSLLDGSDPELLDLISDRVAVIYDMLYEDVEDDEAEEEGEDEDDESLSELEKELRRFEKEEDEEEGEDEDDESLSELEKELRRFEKEEDEDEEEDEDIIDLDKEMIE